MGRIIFIGIILIVATYSCGEKKHQKSIFLIQEIKDEYAPDQRTTIFNIEVTGTNPVILSGETNLQVPKEALILKLREAGIRVEDKIIMLPDESVGEQKHGIISVSVANLRTKPKHSAELATQALLGTPISILKKQNGWVLVQTPDKYISWTNEGSLEAMEDPEFNSWKNAKKIIYLNTTGYSLNLSKTNRVSDLVAGNILVSGSENEDYWSVIYPDNKKALILKEEAMELQSWYVGVTPSDSSITDAALTMLGTPYLWGGTSTKGLDCSGFTKTVYFLHGFILPRDASQQVNIGALIDNERDFSHLEVGDLLFFGKQNDDQSEKVVHVGLWLGDNQFIHASTDVHISSMDSLDENFDSYNFNRYLRTKRIIDANANPVASLLDYYY